MYFFEADRPVGGVSALTAIAWLILLAAGIKILRGAAPSNPVRAAFRRRLGLGLAGLSGLGLLLLLIRFLDGNIIEPGIDNLPVISWPLWPYLVLLATVAFLSYLYWYYRGPYKQHVAETRGVRVVRPRPQREQPERREREAAVSSPAEADPRSEAITGRRESRRDRKRRKR